MFPCSRRPSLVFGDLRKLVKIGMLNWNVIDFVSPMFYDTLSCWLSLPLLFYFYNEINFLNVWTGPISFSHHFFHICKLVNEKIRNPKWFVNNCFTNARFTDWNFEQWLPFTNPLRPVNFNKHHFSIFSHFNRSSATVLNKVMSMQIHMLYKILFFFY